MIAALIVAAGVAYTVFKDSNAKIDLSEAERLIASEGKCKDVIGRLENVATDSSTSKEDKLKAYGLLINCKIILEDNKDKDDYINQAAALSKEVTGSEGYYGTLRDSANEEQKIKEAEEALPDEYYEPGSDGNGI